MNGIIFNIQNYCISDGPGIRTVIFFKGCPLNCLWCENPESIYPKPQISFHIDKCILCGKCSQVCPCKAINLNISRRVNWSFCDNCGRCAEACMAEALEMIGRKTTVEEIMIEIRKEASFYKRSGGGVTISGGEPTLQYDFLMELLNVLKKESYHIVLETCGLLPWNKLELLTDLVDIFYLDIKGIDAVSHKINTGIDNEIILTNAHKLLEKGSRVVFRIPVIPGINDDPGQISQFNDFFSKIGATEIHLLPYHRFGEDKLESIKTRLQPMGNPSLMPENLENIKNIFERNNLTVNIGEV